MIRDIDQERRQKEIDEIANAIVAKLAMREAELLELCGPCGFPTCRLHLDHGGYCDIVEEPEKEE